MARPLNVLLLSSEVEPFAKTGGLADVSSALPKSIKALHHEIRILMPRYGSIDERKCKLHGMNRLKNIPVPMGKKQILANVCSSVLENGHVRVQTYFLDNPPLYERPGIYVHPETGKDFGDNDERFIFFACGALEVLKHLGWQPDIIHCNDWPTGLVPAYLKTLYKEDPFYKRTKSVFTIHNMAYQGVFPRSSFQKTGLPASAFTSGSVEEGGKLNLLKAGLVFADAISTVSEKYAVEIQTAEYGCGLDPLMRKRRKALTGILNGIDYALWDPATDPAIHVNYDAQSIDQKSANKRALLKYFNLPFAEDVPVIGVISRLAEQKGFDILMDAFDDIMKLPLQFVALGVGEHTYQRFLEQAQKKYGSKVGVELAFNPDLAHLIEAGSDMFLMASRYEPCGLNQMYSMRYGTVPIARATGGLDDTIEEFNAATGKGTGFKFEKYGSIDLLDAIRRALTAFNDQSRWKKLMRNGMAKDFTWEASARKYVKLYRELAKA